MQGEHGPPDEIRRFGLVVDDEHAARQAPEAAGAELLPGGSLDVRDPFGNLVQVVRYDEVQFAKTNRILAGMGLALGKTAQALAELREKGLADERGLRLWTDRCGIITAELTRSVDGWRTRSAWTDRCGIITAELARSVVSGVRPLTGPKRPVGTARGESARTGAGYPSAMPMYQRLGEVPRKRHIQFRDNGTLLTEEVLGLEGFAGNESILYHLQSPCRIRELGEFEPIERDEWVPEAHAHRHLRTWDVPEHGDPIGGRRLLLWNDDVEISLCRPSEAMDFFYRNGEGDEVIFVHEGSGTLETIFGDLPYRKGDYIVVPRGTTYRFVGERPQRHLVFESPGLIEIPRRYRNEYGQLLEHAPYYHRDIHPPTELRTHRERGEHVVRVRVRDGYQTYVLDYHPFDVVGWDGYVYPWTFNIHDFEPITGRIHMPPPSHQTFQGRNFVICSFCPRKLDFDPLAIPIPYHHSNVNSEEMIYYVSGNFSSRKAVEVGSITLHPSGIPHGPHPGLAERSIGLTETHELAVMCDTFHPLRLTTFVRELDDGTYAYSWYEEPAAVDHDEDPAGVTSHL